MPHGAETNFANLVYILLGLLGWKLRKFQELRRVRGMSLVCLLGTMTTTMMVLMPGTK